MVTSPVCCSSTVRYPFPSMPFALGFIRQPSANSFPSCLPQQMCCQTLPLAGPEGLEILSATPAIPCSIKGPELVCQDWLNEWLPGPFLRCNKFLTHNCKLTLFYPSSFTVSLSSANSLLPELPSQFLLQKQKVYIHFQKWQNMYRTVFIRGEELLPVLIYKSHTDLFWGKLTCEWAFLNIRHLGWASKVPFRMWKRVKTSL